MMVKNNLFDDGTQLATLQKRYFITFIEKSGTLLGSGIPSCLTYGCHILTMMTKPTSSTLILPRLVAAIAFVAASWTVAFTIKGTPIDSIRYLGEVHATFSSGENTPFWLVNNLQGLGSPEKNNGYVRAAVFRDPESGRKFSWGAGIDLVGSWRAEAPFSIHQLYGEVRYRSLGAMLGSKELCGELNNPRLSSGNLLYSGNAMPVPQLRAGIFDYADVWGCRGWFAVKGYLAYGMFSDSGWQESWAAPGSKHTENVLYHSKGLWLRGGNPSKFPIIGELGIEMATQFGGKSFKDGKVIKGGHSLKDWLKAFFPTSSAQELFDNEVTSVSGNMLGAYNMAISYLHPSGWSLKAYYEHFFEDHSQMTFEYGWKDGLWGLEAALPRNPFVSEIVYEFLYSKDQTGAVNHDSTDRIPEQVSGRDNYYNHSIYTGWQHWGMGIGNPLALSPIYNRNHNITFLDTRIIAHHVGIAGCPAKDLSWRLLLSFSRNWGTYTHPLPEVLSNFNCLAEMKWSPSKLRGWYGSIGIAGDSGKLLGNSFGVALTIGKTGFFNF